MPTTGRCYWARLEMQAILKSHEFVVQRLEEGGMLVRSLEAATRGLDPAPNFGPALATDRRVLLVGFDPLPGRAGAAGNNSHYSSPSAVAALFLHGTGVAGLFIQSVILPMRFEDFDAGLVDNLADGYLQGMNQVHMILSLGQDIDLGLHVERFATRLRSPLRGRQPQRLWGSPPCTTS